MADPRAARQAALVAILPDGVDVLLVTHLPNIRWLTGFSGSAGMLLVGADRRILITDFRYAAQAPREVGDAAEVIIDRASVWDRLRRVLEGYARSTLAIEGHVTPVRDAERVSALFHGRVTPVVDLVEQLRQSKDDTEVRAIRAAAELATDALAEVLPGIAVGDTELQIAARLEYALRRRGSEWHPFQTIVASGPRAALPHARSSERKVAQGEFLLIDFGAQLDGYCSDITRTVAIGTVDERQRAVYDLVRESQLNARTEIRAGMTGREADALARDLIAARGYGDAFGHSLGHGLGLEVHEAPRLAATADAVLPVGAVVTIEPGIYLSGWGGVRLEDDVLLADGGPVLLSDGRTDLIILDA
ncbi:MAG: aminopeptidase P family protein [Gemmatimonadota bacterium]